MNPKRVSFILAATVVSAFALLAGGALGTPPVGQVAAVLGRGTTSEPVRYDVPKVVTITKKVRVKRNGKFVTVTRKVKQTIQSPVIACDAASPCDVVQQKVTFPVGGNSGWHSHPGFLLAVIISGSFTAYHTDCSKQVYAAGQTFVELGPSSTAIVKNEGTVPTEVLVTVVAPAGTPNPGLRIDQPQPSTCSA